MTDKSILERLKVCWYVLTMRNYVFLAYKSADKMLNYNDANEVTGVKGKSMHGLYHIEDVQFSENITLRSLICENVIRVVKKIKNNEL